jgi:hypothetical protein
MVALPPLASGLPPPLLPRLLRCCWWLGWVGLCPTPPTNPPLLLAAAAATALTYVNCARSATEPLFLFVVCKHLPIASLAYLACVLPFACHPSLVSMPHLLLTFHFCLLPLVYLEEQLASVFLLLLLCYFS